MDDSRIKAWLDSAFRDSGAERILDGLSEEDHKVLDMSVANQDVLLLWALASPALLARSYFIAGMMWQKFKDDMDSPLQDLLKDVDI